MAFLFISDSCITCKVLLHDIPDNWTSQIKVLNVKFDKELNGYRIYDNNNKPLPDKAPVKRVPVLWLPEENKIYSGYTDIMNRFIDGER